MLYYLDPPLSVNHPYILDFTATNEYYCFSLNHHKALKRKHLLHHYYTTAICGAIPREARHEKSSLH